MLSNQTRTAWGIAALAVCGAPFLFARSALAGGGGPGLPPCVPLGDCVVYAFCRPALPPGSDWVGGNGSPVAYEDDSVVDDVLGPTGGSGDPALVTVCRYVGGMFSGGTQLDGFGEIGDPEIKVCWLAAYPSLVTNTETSSATIGAQSTSGQSSSTQVGSSVSATRTVIRYAVRCSGDVAVVPC